MDIVDINNEDIICIPYDLIKNKVENNDLELL